MRNILICSVALLLNLSPTFAQNRVLELDGTDSYVELPPNTFANLTQATVEVWAKFDVFNTYSRVLEFGGPWQSLSLFNHDRYPDIRYNLYPQFAKNDRNLIYSVRANGVLKSGEWVHLAALSGPGGMELYVNGAFMGRHTNAASFADIKVAQTNYIGRGMARNPGDQEFRGQIDEVRVWNYRRSGAQIRDNMHKRLTGQEPGLVGLWNFDDGTARDATANAANGKLLGDARIVPADANADLQILKRDPHVAAQPVAVVTSPPAKDPVAWWIAGALTLLVALVAWVVFMLRRSGLGGKQAVLPAATQPAGLLSGGEMSGDKEIKERALAELTEFAKQSLVQVLYSQRNALLETQKSAEKQLADLEAKLAAMRVQDRISAYERRIAELEKELETRNDEVRELASATLLLLRRKLEEEKERERTGERFN